MSKAIVKGTNWNLLFAYFIFAMQLVHATKEFLTQLRVIGAANNKFSGQHALQFLLYLFWGDCCNLIGIILECPSALAFQHAVEIAEMKYGAVYLGMSSFPI